MAGGVHWAPLRSQMLGLSYGVSSWHAWSGRDCPRSVPPLIEHTLSWVLHHPTKSRFASTHGVN